MWTSWAKMSVREAMITIAGKPGYGEQPRWLEKVADAANISKRAARSLWRGEIQSDNHRAAIAVRRAAELKALKEADAIANNFKLLIGRLEQTDSNFHGPTVVALLGALRAMGRSDRT